MPDVAAMTLSHVAMLLRERGDKRRPTLDSRLQDDLAFSSLNLIMLLTGLCEALGIDMAGLSDVELAQMETVREVADVLSVSVPG